MKPGPGPSVARRDIVRGQPRHLRRFLKDSLPRRLSTEELKAFRAQFDPCSRVFSVLDRFDDGVPVEENPWAVPRYSSPNADDLRQSAKVIKPAASAIGLGSVWATGVGLNVGLAAQSPEILLGSYGIMPGSILILSGLVGVAAHKNFRAEAVDFATEVLVPSPLLSAYRDHRPSSVIPVEERLRHAVGHLQLTVQSHFASEVVVKQGGNPAECVEAPTQQGNGLIRFELCPTASGAELVATLRDKQSEYTRITLEKRLPLELGGKLKVKTLRHLRVDVALVGAINQAVEAIQNDKEWSEFFQTGPG